MSMQDDGAPKMDRVVQPQLQKKAAMTKSQLFSAQQVEIIESSNKHPPAISASYYIFYDVP
jgi:hypothetical protein